MGGSHHNMKASNAKVKGNSNDILSTINEEIISLYAYLEKHNVSIHSLNFDFISPHSCNKNIVINNNNIFSVTMNNNTCISCYYVIMIL